MRERGKMALQIEQTADADGILHKRRPAIRVASTLSNMLSDKAGAITTLGNPPAKVANRRTPIRDYFRR